MSAHEDYPAQTPNLAQRASEYFVPPIVRLFDFEAIDHLCPEVVVAYIDHELEPIPARRVARHLAKCDECRAEVEAQRKASFEVRRLCKETEADVHPSPRLLQRLAHIESDYSSYMYGGQDGVYSENNTAGNVRRGLLYRAVRYIQDS